MHAVSARSRARSTLKIVGEYILRQTLRRRNLVWGPDGLDERKLRKRSARLRGNVGSKDRIGREPVLRRFCRLTHFVSFCDGDNFFFRLTSVNLILETDL